MSFCAAARLDSKLSMKSTSSRSCARSLSYLSARSRPAPSFSPRSTRTPWSLVLPCESLAAVAAPPPRLPESRRYPRESAPSAPRAAPRARARASRARRAGSIPARRVSPRRRRSASARCLISSRLTSRSAASHSFAVASSAASKRRCSSAKRDASASNDSYSRRFGSGSSPTRARTSV